MVADVMKHTPLSVRRPRIRRTIRFLRVSGPVVSFMTCASRDCCESGLCASLDSLGHHTTGEEKFCIDFVSYTTKIPNNVGYDHRRKASLAP